ncbi:type I-E CRISPR-associated protein Cas7/Cse4/CasC [Actinosynnema sp. NPDC047251]|uniref:CRISPR-associated Cse4 family protein n=1 Tax=Saccharothrix espanaensis (strain ATCC 51144 / DSM 44229 / JCM 9112 / NBRC 15066 / NRRL 15764) TaxID=1179773 RepID=K0JPY2_SACES|nr:type I-E CRISPR-associated protein Cas7/Cse4/CasC [Saccharothrix espanaensis]CCH29290.1 CRISPR-associated Cse4 family protein [Saccharothrix espanaensis DSM 44229]
MPRTIIDFHIVQTVPPSNINRDDTGSPKTAIYGGRRRARVSSQAWKRATRDAFDSLLDTNELGVRTKRVVELLAEEILRQNAGLADRARELAETVLTAAGIKITAARKSDAPRESGYLLFLSNRQVSGLAELAVDAAAAAGDGKVEISKQDARARADREHSVDVALFGRMVADASDLNVDAACQVAHALSVHAVDNEYDYFTAVDDHKNRDEEEDAGAGMIGTVEFNSSTLYRYATVDVDRLHDNLGDPAATTRAVEAFTRAFVSSMPTGKQNTFANRTLPDAVLVVVRETQSINLVGAFEEAVEDDADGGRVVAAIARLADHARELHEAYDERPVAAWVFGVGEKKTAPLAELAQRATFDPTVRAVGALVAERLPEHT